MYFLCDICGNRSITDEHIKGYNKCQVIRLKKEIEKIKKEHAKEMERMHKAYMKFIF